VKRVDDLSATIASETERIHSRIDQLRNELARRGEPTNAEFEAIAKESEQQLQLVSADIREVQVAAADAFEDTWLSIRRVFSELDEQLDGVVQKLGRSPDE